MNYAGKFGSGELDPFSGADIGLGPLLSPQGHLSSPGKFQVDKVSTHAPSDAIIVPDAHLLFTGDFKRSGVDLILSAQDRELVLPDYFRGEKRAALASPDGAHLTGDIVNALAGHTQFAQADGSASVAPAVIGHVTKLTGNATAIRNGVSIILNQGDTVHKGDVVQSGSDSTLGITFIDGTVFGLASNAKMVLNEMIYDPNGSDNKSLLSLVAGTISFVAGATAKKGDMKVDTPVATMGIRGTAVLVEIDFEVPSQGGAPPAKFQVLVEPDGTTGSYILFDKTTLTPIATVNRAGTQTIINGQGAVSFQSSVQLSPDAQKIISDVFSLKFTDLNNPNTKLTTNFTDTIVPETLFVKLSSNDVVPVTLQFVNVADRSTAPSSRDPGPSAIHIAGPPLAAANGGAVAERIDVTASPTLASISGTVNYADINPDDVPSVQAAFSSFVYANAQQADVTATLTAAQLAAIKAVQVPLAVVQDPNGKNTGQATWTYTIADGAFDFLASGETLSLTYLARVDNNYGPSNETTFVPFTIVITGTNDKPTLSATGGTITERTGTGNAAVDTVTGTVTFADVDLTDRPVVSAAISTTDPFRYYDAEGNDITATLTPAQLAAILAVEVPLTVVQAAGNTHNGSATWTYSIADSAFDFIAKGETLTLNYIATVDDGHGGVISTPITVSIQGGADVVVIGTNDVPTIVDDLTTATDSVTEDEAATLVAGGTITFQDLDLTDTHTATFVLKSSNANANLPGYSEASPLGEIGTFSLTSVSENPGVTTVGSIGWNFALNNNDPVLQSLAVGQTITQVYAVTFDDHHGGTVTQDVTVVITGTNDAPTIVAGSTASGSVTEDVDVDADEIETSGTIAFEDVDLIDTHTASFVLKSSDANADLPGYSEAAPFSEIGTFALTTVSEYPTDTTNTASLGWTFTLDNDDPTLQSLALNQTITQIYTITVSDGHGGTVTQDVTVTITGANDAPTIVAGSTTASGSVTEDVDVDADEIETSGTIAFEDVDLIDTHTASFVLKSSDANADLPGYSEAAPFSEIGTFALATVSEYPTDTTNTASLGWTFTLDNDDPTLQSLALNQTITQIYTITVSDGHGGTVAQDVSVTITGTNDAPSIVGEVDPAVQTVIVAAPTAPVVLAPGVNVNSLGLDTETFDGVPAGSSSNNGAGTGTFQSAALGATFSASGNSGVVIGSSSATAAPFVGPLPGSQDTTKYLSIGGGGVETITFASEKNAFGLYWGSLDSYNTIKFYDGTTLVASYTGNDISPLFPTGSQGSFSSNGYVEFSGLQPFDKVVLRSSSNAFEIDNISAGNVPTPDTGLSGPINGTLSVHDGDIGDTLTAFVIGNATIEYNGSASLPGSIDISALVDAAGVTFDSAPSNGGTVALHWTYQPINANLDFLNAGDILKIKFVAEVSDGHGHTGSQPLTITLVGADGATNGSSILAAGPVIGTDAFSVTENGDGTTTVSGLYVSDSDATAPNDTFTIDAAANSASGSVLPPTGDGSLAAVNATLDSGITYDPGNTPPQTDMVTLTVSDGLGHSDTVHFVFNEAAQGPVTLTGTPGKDIIFASGSDDTLTGGASADQFVFAPGQNPGADTITDFTPGQDRIDLRLFSEVVGSDNINGWLSANAVQSSTNPADVLISLGNDTLTLKNVTVTSLHAGDFIVSPHHVT